MSDIFVWQDREIRFDANQSQLKIRKGEYKVELLPNIEDTKGNPDEKGSLLISNLRIIWYSNNSPKINLTIGYDCIISIEIKISYSQSLGSTQSLNIKSKYQQSRFEFIFSTINHESPRIFTTFQAVCRAYEGTKLYRDLKLRGAIIQNKTLNLLQLEKIINQYHSIYNLSSEQGNGGYFIFTNIRIVWFSNNEENFNISIPYIQIKSIKKRDSKFGMAIVIETSGYSGSYILGFQTENLENILQELIKLQAIYFENPILGLPIDVNENNDKNDEILKRNQDDIKIIDSDINEIRKITNYVTEFRGKEVNYNIDYNLYIFFY